MRKRTTITMEIENEVVLMTKEGHSTKEICESVGISKASVSRIRREHGLSHPNDRGGRIARTIPVTELQSAARHTDAEDDSAPIVIADQSIAICGTETLTTYRAELKKDAISVDGELVVGEIPIDQIMNLANELKGVYDLVMKMKGNRFGLVK